MISPKTTKVALVKDGVVTAHGTCSSLYPQTSFPAKITEDQAQADFGLYVIRQVPVGEYQTSTPVDPYFEGGEVYGNQVGDMTAGECKVVMRRKLQNQFVASRDKGVEFNGTTIMTTHNAQQELEALVAYLAREGGSQKIRTRSGVVIDADLATAAAMRDLVAAHISSVWNQDAVLGEQIEAATTLEELQAIDLEVGW